MNILILDFEKNFKNRQFTDNSGVIKTKYEVIGYGDNQGTPYFVGLLRNNDNTFEVKTVLMRNAVFSAPPS